MLTRSLGKYGYLNDNMVSIRLLLANGTVATASDEENTSLFWAVRGAGHNFGIALESTFQVYPQQNQGKHYVVDFEFELDAAEGIFETMNQISSPMPAELAVFIIGRSRGHTGGVRRFSFSFPIGVVTDTVISQRTTSISSGRAPGQTLRRLSTCLRRCRPSGGTKRWPLGMLYLGLPITALTM
jgi:FAD/FMN-containing dehydrogenase